MSLRWKDCHTNSTPCSSDHRMAVAELFHHEIPLVVAANTKKPRKNFECFDNLVVNSEPSVRVILKDLFQEEIIRLPNKREDCGINFIDNPEVKELAYINRISNMVIKSIVDN